MKVRGLSPENGTNMFTGVGVAPHAEIHRFSHSHVNNISSHIIPWSGVKTGLLLGSLEVHSWNDHQHFSK